MLLYYMYAGPYNCCLRCAVQKIIYTFSPISAVVFGLAAAYLVLG